MIGDLFKIFVEEPEKLTKVGLRIIRTIFLLMISEALYRLFFGPYSLMKLSEYSEWVTFILSGRLLMVIACYLIAKFVIEPFFDFAMYLIVVRFLCSRGILKINKNELAGYLKVFDIVKLSKDNKIPKPGSNIDILYGIASDFKDENEIEGYNNLKHSVLDNILNLFPLFFVVYFFFLKTNFHNNYFIFIVIACFVLCILSYVVINNLIELLKKDYQEIIDGLDIIKDNHLVYESLSKFLIKPYRDEARIGKEEFFECRGKLFALVFNYGNSQIGGDRFLKYLRKLDNAGRHLFIIARTRENSVEFSDLGPLSKIYTVISYTNAAELKLKLENELVKKILGS